MDNLITVTKTASEQVSPNRIRIDVTACGNAETCAEAAALADKSYAAALAIAKKLSLSITQGGMNVHAVYGDGKIAGYGAERSLAVRLDMSGALDKIIAELGKTSLVFRVNFLYEDDGVREKLIAQAVRGARKDAELIAEAAGVKIKALYGVEFAPSYAPVMLRAANSGAGSAEAEKITLSESVVCAFTID